MNTRKYHRADPIERIRSYPGASLGALVFVSFAHGAHGQPKHVPLRAPNLQRVAVMETQSYAMSFSDPRARAGRALVIEEGAKPGGQNIVTVFPFGRNLGIDARTGKIFPPREGDGFTARAHRWSICGGCVFTASRLSHGYNVSRFPIQSFVHESDANRAFLDGRIEGFVAGGGPTMIVSGGLSKPRHTWLSAIFKHQAGIAGWREGDDEERADLDMGDPPTEIHYDIRALDDVQMHLYLAADGRMQRWLFDGARWRLEKKYGVEIDGPFLTCNEGRGVVSEREGHWCLIENLDEPTLSITPIVERKPGKPPILIEDIAKKKNYFESDERASHP